MMRPGWKACLLLSILAVACSRHHVVSRDAGRVDGARSITTNTDPGWTVLQEPEAATDEQVEETP